MKAFKTRGGPTYEHTVSDFSNVEVGDVIYFTKFYHHRPDLPPIDWVECSVVSVTKTQFTVLYQPEWLPDGERYRFLKRTGSPYGWSCPVAGVCWDPNVEGK